MLQVTLLPPNQPKLAIDFVIDTGFEGYLTLPKFAVEKLELPFAHRIVANLADDTGSKVSVHNLSIIWDDQVREIYVLAMGKRPLLGTKLLEDHDLKIHFAENGGVDITPFA